jgi:hypothetical protein
MVGEDDAWTDSVDRHWSEVDGEPAGQMLDRSPEADRETVACY